MAPINVRKGAVISANGVYTGVTINTAGQLEIARLNAENIRKGVDILGAIGTMEGATSVEEYMRLIDYIANMRDLRPINENDYNNKCVERTQALINFYRGED